MPITIQYSNIAGAKPEVTLFCKIKMKAFVSQLQQEIIIKYQQLYIPVFWGCINQMGLV